MGPRRAPEGVREETGSVIERNRENPLRTDALVVGAGPAGATAAERLAANGLRTILIEAEPLPRYKTCGGGLVPRARVALPTSALSAIEHACDEAEMRVDGRSLTLTGQTWVAMAMRSRLDAALVDAARLSGAEVLTQCRLNGIERRPGGVLASTSRGTILTRHLVAADGANSTAARLAGWSAPPPGLPALEWELEVTPEQHAHHAGIARFDFDAIPGGYAWIFPKRSHLSVGILSTRRPAPDLRRLLEAYLRDRGLESAPREEHGFVIPTRPRRDGFGLGRVLLTGDAAGLADPITAEGISHALISGRLAAEAIVSRREADAAEEYERRLRPLLRELSVARVLAKVLYGSPRLRRLLFTRLGDSLTRAVGTVIAGDSTYLRHLLRPSHLPRAAGALLRSRLQRPPVDTVSERSASRGL